MNTTNQACTLYLLNYRISQFSFSSCNNRSLLVCTSCFNAKTSCRLHVFIKRECNICVVGDQIIKILVRAPGVTRVTLICMS